MVRSIQLPAPGRGAYDRSLSRSERDAQHRERLLLAAAEVLAHGPATVARIVERAGVGRSTFYEFFDSPEHVLEHLEQRALRGLESALETAFNEARTPLERVRAIARTWLTELEARPVEARVALTRRVGGDLLAPASKLLHQVLERCVQAARQDGMGWFNAADDVSLLAAAAAIEALSRRHLAGRPLRDAPRTLSELITKLLR
jgi:AcrR family transcriptional regulator